MPEKRSTENITGALHTRASFNPQSLDKEARTVDVVFATEREVMMYNWSIGRFNEVLVCEDGAGDLTRLNNGAPLLDAHDDSSVRTLLGAVVPGSARFSNGQAVATVRFSNRSDVQGIWQDVQDGIITGISVGYMPLEYQETTNPQSDTIPSLRCTKWEATEISLAPVPADRDSKVRTADKETPHTIQIIRTNSNSNTMETVETNGTGADTQQRTAQPQPAPAPATDTTVAPAVNEAEVRKAAATAERARIKEIRTACKAAKLDEAFTAKLEEDGTSIEQARKLIIDKMAENNPVEPAGQSGVRVGADEVTKRRTAMTDGILLRAGQAGKEVTAERQSAAREFRGMTLMDIAKDCLTRAGIDFRYMDKMEIAGRAITSSTSDFPVLLGGVIHQTLLARYASIPDTWRGFCKVGSMSDFRPYSRIRQGSFGRLDKITEDAEFKNKPMPDGAAEKNQLATFGNLVNISRKMIVNDDLGAFTDIAAQLGRSAARSIEIDVYALLLSNPTMADGQALFSAAHNNLVATGVAPSVTAFDAMRVMLASQMEPSANDFLALAPSVLLVPIGLGGLVKTLNNAMYDPSVTNKFQVPNIVNGLFRNIIDTPRLSGTAYYAFADAAEEPVLEVGFLDGNQSPFLEMQQGFEVDGLQWKVRLDYGVGAIGWRGAIKNPGA